MGMVWTHAAERVQQTMELSDQDLCRRLQDVFGSRLGAFQAVSQRAEFPLQLSFATQSVAERLVLVGNAAHTLHPVAGQGFNLGMRDVAVLVELLSQAAIDARDPGSDDLLKEYARRRKSDHQTIIGFTHGLVLGFSNALAPLRMARGLGLLLTDVITPFKHYLATTSMGLQLPQAKLILQRDE